ncbi:helix-turn-helix transcriptional regulator [Tumebacillus avium]|uniref:helix-turn-helix transcriptional regulator n=1 Tax=Tumebacillus avium TaxID=1903704 RepID=UPI0012FE3603
MIKELRLALGLKQEALPDGICVQGQLSKIEKGEYIPTSSTHYELARRLGGAWT